MGELELGTAMEEVGKQDICTEGSEEVQKRANKTYLGAERGKANKSE